MNLVFLGPPGAGKGTQTTRLAEQYKLTKIATGDLMREEIKAATPLGHSLKALIEAGKFADDSITLGLVRKAILVRAPEGGLIFDGFPRTLSQAEMLNGLCQELNLKLDGAIYLAVDEERLIDRISGRFQCASCGEPYHKQTNPPRQAGICNRCAGTEFTQRADDKAEIFRARLSIYDTQTAPIIDYYREQEMLATVEGNASIEEVWEQIIRVLETDKRFEISRTA